MVPTCDDGLPEVPPLLDLLHRVLRAQGQLLQPPRDLRGHEGLPLRALPLLGLCLLHEGAGQRVQGHAAGPQRSKVKSGPGEAQIERVTDFLTIQQVRDRFG